MSATKTLHPDEKIKAGTLGSKMSKAGFGAGIVLIILAYVLGHLQDDHLRRFQFAYLTAWFFVCSIAIGCLFFVLIHHLTRARWSTVMRRIAENVSLTFPVLAILGIGFIAPMLMGNHELYFWSYFGAHKELHAADPHMVGKMGWLTPGFFAVRFVIYMAIYSALAIKFSKDSRKQDETGDLRLSERLRVLSGVGMLVFALTTVFIGFDVIMSLAPKWYSTIYSVNLFGGAMIGTYAFLGLLTRAIQKSGRLTRSITVEHYQDVGKFLFGFTFFWAYTAFSQFMLIWYANIPEEIVFYRYRMFGDWQYLSIAVLVLHWAVPYVLLMSRWTKRILPIFMALCAWQLFFHYIDIYWNVMPNMTWLPEHGHLGGPLTGDPQLHKFTFSAVDLLCLLGMLALFIGAIGRNMKGNLLPVKDPHLSASLAFENY